jgi:DNA (cytosine-5)-methyltransferase 1
LKYLSLCSGIEAATVAWHPLGWEAVAYSEIERFPSEVLAHHYPSTPNLGDMTKFKEWNLESNVDLLVGGTPCQSFSVAGLRKGLDDPRGNLMLTYLAIAKQYRPNWLVWENVPGVLSSNGGRDFGSFLGGLAECGYGFAYRVLDAQYFGVAQRRRRVFVVGYLGDWRAAAAVLFERHSLSGHPAPSREKRQGIAPSFRAGSPDGNDTIGTLMARDYKGIGNQDLKDGRGLVLNPIALAENTIGRQPQNGGNGDGFTDGGPMYTLNATGVHGVAQPIPFGISEKPYVGHCLRSSASRADKHESTTYVAQPVYEMHGQDSRVRELGDVCTTVSATYGTGGGNVPITIQPIAFSGQMSNPQTDVDMTQTLQAKNPMAVAHSVVAPTLTATNDPSRSPQSSEVTQQVYSVYQSSMAVRRLTPVECERLQGFGDNYTDIKSKGKPTPDGPRYKALGNSMAVPVMRWIGERIKQYEEMA